MTLGRLNHVGVATPSIAASIETYRNLLGATTIGEPFDLPAQGVKVCFIDAPNMQIELIEPYDDASPIAGFRRKFIDEVIQPHSTRRRVALGLRKLRGKQLENPWKKHDNIPL